MRWLLESGVKIQEANLMLERFSKNGHFDIVDINPELSADGVLKSEYTLDGIHFNGRAYEIWTGKLMRVAGLSARSASREERKQR
jgi:lysophospholipase L1-like esterase